MNQKIHNFDTTKEAYGATQCDDNINTGDILIINSEGVVGLAYTWPIALTEVHGAFHTVTTTIQDFVDDDTFTQEQVDAALKVAAEMDGPSANAVACAELQAACDDEVVLANGATVIQVHGDAVLAKLRGEYVTWKMNPEKNADGTVGAYWGHYFDDDLIAAARDLKTR